MRCKNCYNELPFEANYCPSCSFPNPLAGQLDRNPQPEATVTTVAPEMPTANGNGYHVVSEPALAEAMPVALNDSETEAVQPEVNAVTGSEPETTAPVQVTNETAPVVRAATASNGTLLNYSASVSATPNYNRPVSPRPQYTARSGAGKPPTRPGATGQPIKPKKPVTASEAQKILKARTAEKEKEQRRESLLKMARIALYVVLAVGAGYLILKTSGFLNTQATPQDSLMTLSAFKNLPSNQEGLTVDARLAKEVEAAKKSGPLVKFQGWSTKPILNEPSKVSISFAFEGSDGKHSAEWTADLANHTYIPQTDLAKQVYSK